MSKIIFLGTDLHGAPTELAAKTVNSLKKIVGEYKIVSIEHRKDFKKQENTLIIPKIFFNSLLRRIFQAISLPLYLGRLRLKKYNVISTFWVANKRYHQLLFYFLKFIGFKIIFTVISGEDTKFGSLNKCDLIVCQSERMKKTSKYFLPNSNIELIYPGVNLGIFKPKKKNNDVVLPSVPYKLADFSQRGIEESIKAISKNSLKSIIIFRSDESYSYVKDKGLEKSQLINKPLSDKYLADIIGKTKIMPLFYSQSPDMPLSAIEGLASGCAVICTEKMGLSELIKDYGGGIVVNNEKQLSEALGKIIRNSSYNKKAREVAEKFFSSDEFLRKYKEIFNRT